jgi:hypothetical protein
MLGKTLWFRKSRIKERANIWTNTYTQPIIASVWFIGWRNASFFIG